MGMKIKTETKPHRKSKAALAAGAVAGTVAATAAYRRHQARRHLGNADRPNRSEDGATQSV
jgi:hypothetical protein